MDLTAAYHFYSKDISTTGP